MDNQNPGAGATYRLFRAHAQRARLRRLRLDSTTPFQHRVKKPLTAHRRLHRAPAAGQRERRGRRRDDVVVAGKEALAEIVVAREDNLRRHRTSVGGSARSRRAPSSELDFFLELGSFAVVYSAAGKSQFSC